MWKDCAGENQSSLREVWTELDDMKNKFDEASESQRREAFFPWRASSLGRQGNHRGGETTPDPDELPTPKIKEADRIDVPAFPTILTVHAWRTKLINAVLVAPGNHHLEKIIKWLAMSGTVDSMDTLDDLGGPAYVMLDIKLSTGMTEMLRKAGDKSKRVRERVELKMDDITRRVTAS